MLIDLDKKEINLLLLMYKEFKTTPLYKNCLGIKFKKECEKLVDKLSVEDVGFMGEK